MSNDLFPQAESMKWTFISIAVVGVFFSALALMNAQRPCHPSQRF